jgi:PleD family two-component response regulator
VSIGVAAREAADRDDPQAMLRRADDALYEAKHSGRDRVAIRTAATVAATAGRHLDPVP